MARDQCFRFVCSNRIHSGLNALVTDCRCGPCQLTVAFLLGGECGQRMRVDPRRCVINASELIVWRERCLRNTSGVAGMGSSRSAARHRLCASAKTGSRSRTERESLENAWREKWLRNGARTLPGRRQIEARLAACLCAGRQNRKACGSCRAPSSFAKVRAAMLAHS